MGAAEEPARGSDSDSDSILIQALDNRGHGSSSQSVTAELGDGVSEEEGVFDGLTQTPISGNWAGTGMAAAASLD